VIILVAATSGIGSPARGTIVIGSKNFTEQVVLGELLAQTLERRGIAVTRRLNLGGSFICDRAIRSGDIDIYVEYTGTALAAISEATDRQGAGRCVCRCARRLRARRSQHPAAARLQQHLRHCRPPHRC
jgi:glycine betaine/choline ABC-type transport system substrate-binding protein